MKQTGSADLKLMGGYIPDWLFGRMVALARPVVESVVLQYGWEGFLQRLSDPYWFQAFGAVIGMDWNSSGVTTAVMRALKQALNPVAHELGMYVCGGKGTDATNTPHELLAIGDKTGIDADALVRCSRLSAKVDSAAVQDGFQVYLHFFVLTADGGWAVVQQGMRPADGAARRYHWLSSAIRSFVEEPHAAVCGEELGPILNLTDRAAAPTRQGILQLAAMPAPALQQACRHLRMPRHDDVSAADVNLKRLTAILHLAYQQDIGQFEDLLLLKGLGARTLQSLTLVSEVIHGTPSRFADPARFSLAHGSKTAKPFAVPTRVYDEVVVQLQTAVAAARLGHTDRHQAIGNLSKWAGRLEARVAAPVSFDAYLQFEKQQSHRHGGRSLDGWVAPPA
ncbi:MAG: DUF763 domain-containing protein [Chitinophagaceae bacterium]|nr:DUF763 domain-containing protein [Chitinophagaceae bacterium]